MYVYLYVALFFLFVGDIDFLCLFKKHSNELHFCLHEILLLGIAGVYEFE